MKDAHRMTTQIPPTTVSGEPAAPTDRAMHVLQYAVALAAVIGAALLAGFR
jgi:hypothetical protein